MSIIRSRTAKLKLNIPFYDRTGWSDAVDENWRIIDAAISQFIASTGILGVWKNSTDYIVGDTVVDPNDASLWTAIVTHRSAATGTFAADRLLRNNWTLSSTVTPQGEGAIVRPEDYGGDPDTSEDVNNYAAVAAALEAALEQGIPLQLDSMWAINAPLVADMDDHDILRIRGSGGLYVINDLNGQPALNVTCSAESIGDVLLIENNVTHDFGAGQDTDCCRITLAAGHTVPIGAVAKIISNDVILGELTGRFDGEVVFIGDVIYDVDGDTTGVIYTSARLQHTYTTSPRLAVYKQGKRVHIADITIQNDFVALQEGSWQNGGLRLQGLISPIAEKVVFKDIGNYGLAAQGCVSPLILAPRFERGLNAPSSQTVDGIGFRDNNSEFGIYISPSGYDCRHIYSARVVTSDVSNPFTYGRASSFIISNGIGHDCSSAPWDTAEGSENGLFIGLHTANTYKGQDVVNSGIRLRGKRHRVSEYKHLGGGVGVRLGGIHASARDKHIVNDIRYDGDDYAVECSDTGVVYGELDAISAISSNQDGGLYVGVANITCGNYSFSSRSTADNRCAIRMQEGGVLSVETAQIDFATVPVAGGEDSYILGWDGEDVSCVLNSVSLLAGAGTWDLARLFGVLADPGMSLYAKVDADKAPESFNQDGLVAMTVLTNVRVWIIANKGKDFNSAKRGFTLVGAGNIVADIGGCFADTIVREYNVDTASKTVTSISAGQYINQVLIIANVAASTQSFLIANAPSERILINATATVAPGSAVAFYWNGTVWACYSVAVAVTGATPISDHGGLSGLGDDDHTQYHTDARALTYLQTRNLVDLADVPTKGGAKTVFKSLGAGATVGEWALPLSGLPARDVNGYIGPATHTADTAALASAVVSLYPELGAVTNVALRLLSGADKGRFTELVNSAFALLLYARETSDGSLAIAMYNAAGTTIKHFIHSNFMILGGSDAARVGTETLGVVGDMYISGAINGPADPGDFNNPYLIGDIRLWDDGSGNLRKKAASDPTTAVDGTIV